MLYVAKPEEKVDLINFDCNNEDNPSNIGCTGQWFYWNKEDTLQGGEWRVDSSVKLLCRGTIIQKNYHDQ